MKTAIVVLGMHRSGTSSVAGALAQMGFAAPLHLMPPKSDNLSGFWESERISSFNDEILAAAGSSWIDWTPLREERFPAGYTEHIRSASRWLINTEFSGADRIVIKDPRMCRTYPYWHEGLISLGYAPKIICPIRSPISVTNSLVKRNGLSRERCLRMWLRYTLDSELYSRDMDRVFVQWDQIILGRSRKLVDVLDRIGLGISLSKDKSDRIDKFLNPNLCHHDDNLDRSSNHRLVVDAFSAFTDLAKNDDVNNIAKISEIREAFEYDLMLYGESPSAL